MRVVRHEIRKIWNVKMLAVTVVFCIMFILAFDSSSLFNRIRNVDFSRSDAFLETAALDLQHMLSPELLERQRQFYIQGMASDDLFAFAAQSREAFLAEANAFIAHTPIFAESGIHYTNSIRDLWDKAMETEARVEIFLLMLGAESGYVGIMLENVSVLNSNLRDFGEDRTRQFLAMSLERVNRLEPNERQHARLTEILENAEYRGTLHGDIFWSVTDLLRQVSLLLIIASLILHSTLVTTDRMRNMLPLHYHTKVGRRIGMRQFAATLVSSVLLATIVLAGFGLALAQAGVFAYWNEGITSHLTHFGPGSIAAGFWPITFGNYLLIRVALCYALCIGAAAVAFALSRYSRNLITLAIKSVPVFIALVSLHNWALFPDRWAMEFIDRFTAPLTLWNHLYLRTGLPYLDIAIIAAFAAVAVVIAFFIAQREKRLESL